MSKINHETIQMTGLVTSLARDSSVARGLLLRIENGSREGHTVSVGNQSVTIGAGGDCTLVLDEAAISRHHAEVTPAKGGVFVRDLGSTNGTFVNDAKIQEAVVSTGAEFRLGQTTIRVIDGGGPLVDPSERTRFGGLIGESRSMREVFAVLELASPTEATVFLEGPSGTGKELTARAIHDHSPRASGPMIIFDCGTVNKELLSSALMGHKKGAFTGATTDRPGAFVEAENGTIFLDELGELPLECQTQLLRALESNTVTPVGGDRSRPINCRVVAATNRDVYDMVDKGEFRLDLLHRLAVVHVRLPSLKDRLDDLPALIRGFYEGRGLDPGPIDGDNLEQLKRHPFEGNIRELRNILERSLVLAGQKTAFREIRLWLGPQVVSGPEPSGFQIDVNLPFKEVKEDIIEQLEAKYLPEVMKRFNGNVTKASEHAGLSRRHLRALLVKHGLKESSE